MPVRARLAALGITILALACPAGAVAQTPDPAQCYFVPEAGPVATPITGNNAVQYFHACPNNDGGSSLPNNVRIKIVLKDSSGQPAFTTKDMICIQFNGGTPAQGFPAAGALAGADSIIANDTYNIVPRCPNVRCMEADADPVGGVAVMSHATKISAVRAISDADRA